MHAFRELGSGVELVRGIHFEDHHLGCGELGVVPVQWFRQEISLRSGVSDAGRQSND
jgi:hypothetical protein